MKRKINQKVLKFTNCYETARITPEREDNIKEYGNLTNGGTRNKFKVTIFLEGSEDHRGETRRPTKVFGSVGGHLPIIPQGPRSDPALHWDFCSRDLLIGFVPNL